ncbi:MAG: pre-peptidase C-terminal domain-containing protein [Candidatus Poseidonia sp.]|nr:pre-peptidase C-terminal domain-containing protein [Poseidonia sp.]
MKKSLCIVFIFLLSLATPMLGSAQSQATDSIEVLHTAVNPENNNTYHLLSAASWEDSASYARSLDGFLTTVDDETENTWLFDTFASWDNQSRHLWTGLSDLAGEGDYRWHDGTPFLYRNWGEAQPSAGGDEDYVHIASTNMGNIMPGTWNDLENDPQYFPVYGIVEIGPGADYSLRFNGDGDHIVSGHDEHLNVTNATHLSLEAWVFPYHDENIQFIMMKGDYGWGMYLNEGTLAYASEYSLSKHPNANMSVDVETWSHVEVRLERGVGGEFFINGESAGTFGADKATIPVGDFGSNDCFTSGEDCDELYLARMGAGCECNYFEGLMDNISISIKSDSTPVDTWDLISHWSFSEGEGDLTTDEFDSGTREGFIEGADWVMPDGSIVAQAVELFIGDSYDLDEASAGDTLLFFTEIEEYTRTLSWSSYSIKFDDFESMTAYTLYSQSQEIPDEWNHDSVVEAQFGFIFNQWSWPDEGTMWFTMVLDTDVTDLIIELDADIADPPPTLDDMTELMESIPVTNQEVFSGNGDIGANYYYVNVTEPLADLRVRTYGGMGNIDIGISYYSPPTPTGWWGNEEPVEFDEDGKEQTPILEAWSTNQGNNEEVHLFDVEPGLYYITAYSFRNAREFTIVADFVYPPDNVEPDDAITLTPGVEYGLISGYKGLSQYFKVNVPQDTERLIIDLSDGAGEAALFMRLDQAPTKSTYEHHSTSEGAEDRIAFNDPTPGWWYILLTTDSAFTGVNIVAEFADRYVWDYDGIPIELFNDEPLDGISVGKDGSIEFYSMLAEPGEYFQVETYGGSGDIQILIDGVQYEVIFTGGGRPGPGAGVDTDTSDVTIKGGMSGTNHVVTLELPMNGRMDITIRGVSDAEEFGLVARWVETDFPIEPVEPVEPTEVVGCSEDAKNMFTKLDLDATGLLEGSEINNIDASSDDRNKMDLNGDEVIEYREYLQHRCSCQPELVHVFDAFSQGRERVTIQSLEGHQWANSYDFEAINANGDEDIDEEELELLLVLCETTFDAFDGDGDGVPDEKDAFPDNPDESKDTDGDGVGDNADIVASVSNDILYASAGLVFILLAGLLFAFMRSNQPEAVDMKEWDDEARFEQANTMFDESKPMISEQAPSSQSNPQQLSYELPEPAPTNIALQPIMDAPDTDLMGMILDGVETIEHPSGSGNLWTRDDPMDPWSPKI